MTPLLPEVSSLVDQLTHWLPRAKAVCDDGDGLRSPSLEGSVSGGGWSDSVQERLVVALDERTDDGRPRQTAAARLARAEDDIAAARRALTCAWADAHRRTKAGPICRACLAGQHGNCAHWNGYSCACSETSSCGMKHPDDGNWYPEPVARVPLRLPSDHLEACALLCSALSDLGPVDDGDGLVADRIRDAHRLLERALSGVQSCLPKRGNDWRAVVETRCSCKPPLPPDAHPDAHRGGCKAGKVRWEHTGDTGDPGCISCARIKGPDGVNAFHSDTRTPGSKLCGACENVTRQRKDQWRAEHPPRCTHCHATVGTDEAAEACPGGTRKEQLKGFAARLASALGADEERPHRWRDQPIPTDQRPFWPPIGFIEHMRDRGHTRATPAQWAGWHAAERAAEAKKRKRSA